MLLLPFKDSGSFFAGEDGVLKAAVCGSFGGWNLDLANDVFALVIKNVSFGRNGGAIAGKAEVDIYGVRHLIDDVTVRKGDIKAIEPAAGVAKLYGVAAGFAIHHIGNNVGVAS